MQLSLHRSCFKQELEVRVGDWNCARLHPRLSLRARSLSTAALRRLCTTSTSCSRGWVVHWGPASSAVLMSHGWVISASHKPWPATRRSLLERFLGWIVDWTGLLLTLVLISCGFWRLLSIYLVSLPLYSSRHNSSNELKSQWRYFLKVYIQINLFIKLTRRVVLSYMLLCP